MKHSTSHRKARFVRRAGPGAQAGFSMIEILIALVVLALGLLGLALLQTTNLRFTKSANQRTQAVNMANDMLDMIRANHTEVAAYTAINPGSFAGVPAEAQLGCQPTASASSAANIKLWKCEVVEALGDDAKAEVLLDAASSQASVRVQWNDEFWDPTKDAASVTLTTRL